MRQGRDVTSGAKEAGYDSRWPCVRTSGSRSTGHIGDRASALSSDSAAGKVMSEDPKSNLESVQTPTPIWLSTLLPIDDRL
jgi:hypothetical protein